MFDNPLFFLILISVLSAISDWLGKRRKAARLREMEAGEVSSPQENEPEITFQEERRQSVPEEKEDWEERLRRMLGADEEPAPIKQHPRPSSQQEPASNYGFEPPPPPTSVFRTEANPAQQQSIPNPVPATTLANIDVTLSEPAPAMQTHVSSQRRRASEINFRSKDAIRKSIVAAVVLGPPKGSGKEADLLQL